MFEDDKKCGDCKWWGKKRLVLWKKVSDNFRMCMREKAKGFTMYVAADSTCSKWEGKNGCV